MDRITAKDVRRAFENHVDALIHHGLHDPAEGRYVLSEGSKTYGNAFRINFIPSGETGHYRPKVGDDFLGWTKREAYDRLTERTRTIVDVFFVHNQRYGAKLR